MDYSAVKVGAAASIAAASDTLVTFTGARIGELGDTAGTSFTTPGLFDFDRSEWVGGQTLKKTVITIGAVDGEPTEHHTAQARGRRYKVVSVTPLGVGEPLMFEVEVRGI